MPVQHDLIQDLDFTQEHVEQCSAKDAKLNKLLEDYATLDAQVLEAESPSGELVADEVLKKLKEKRLLVKDKIVQRLEAA